MKAVMQMLTLLMVVLVGLVIAGSDVEFAVPRGRHLKQKRDAVEGECGKGHFGGIFESTFFHLMTTNF
jgi:hypothetical protein